MKFMIGVTLYTLATLTCFKSLAPAIIVLALRSYLLHDDDRLAAFFICCAVAVTILPAIARFCIDILNTLPGFVIFSLTIFSTISVGIVLAFIIAIPLAIGLGILLILCLGILVFLTFVTSAAEMTLDQAKNTIFHLMQESPSAQDAGYSIGFAEPTEESSWSHA